MNDKKIALDGLVIALDKDGFIHETMIKHGRATCNNLAFKRRYFDNIDLYDQDRNWYKVRSARLIEASIFRKVVFIFFGGRRVVDLDIEFKRRVNQEDIINIIIDSLRTYEDFWSAGVDVDELIDEIKISKDMREVFYYLNFQGQRYNPIGRK